MSTPSMQEVLTGRLSQLARHRSLERGSRHLALPSRGSLDVRHPACHPLRAYPQTSDEPYFDLEAMEARANGRFW